MMSATTEIVKSDNFSSKWASVEQKTLEMLSVVSPKLHKQIETQEAEKIMGGNPQEVKADLNEGNLDIYADKFVKWLNKQSFLQPDDIPQAKAEIKAFLRKQKLDRLVNSTGFKLFSAVLLPLGIGLANNPAVINAFKTVIAELQKANQPPVEQNTSFQLLDSNLLEEIEFDPPTREGKFVGA